MRERLKALKRNVLHLQRQLRTMERELEIILAALGKEDPTEDEAVVEATAARVIGYLNAKTGRSFGATAENTAHLIRCRIAEGWGEADFRAVIDTMVGRWLDDPEWSIYLRPRTLFGDHFEDYLQAAKSGKAARLDVKAFEEMMIRRMQEGAG